MRIAGWLFKPAWWAWAVFLPLLGLLCGLGTWQVDRAQQKTSMIAERSQAGKMTPVTVDEALQAGVARWRSVAVSGEYQADRQILLDNQVEQGRAGFHVWTPLKLDDGRLLMVDRGWVQGGALRSDLPDPAAPENGGKVSGLLRDWPAPGLRLDAASCEKTGWPRVLNYPRFEEVECQFSQPVVDGLLLLSADEPGGFARDWMYVEMPPERHLGYAVTWFGLAVTLTVLFVVVNTRKA